MRIYKEYQAYLLFPLAMFYWGLVYWRNLFYKYGFFITNRLRCHVISVGNITVGGTGKTPTVLFLARYLQNNGKKVGVLSRGYGRSTKGTLLVSDGAGPKPSWEESGDEPYLISKKLAFVLQLLQSLVIPATPQAPQYKTIHPRQQANHRGIKSHRHCRG